MTKPSDYVHWFDAAGLDDVPLVGGGARWLEAARTTEVAGNCVDVAHLLTELGIDATGVNPSNLLRTIAYARDAETAKQRPTAN
jgi:hypothetical protein